MHIIIMSPFELADRIESQSAGLRLKIEDCQEQLDYYRKKEAAVCSHWLGGRVFANSDVCRTQKIRASARKRMYEMRMEELQDRMAKLYTNGHLQLKHLRRTDNHIESSAGLEVRYHYTTVSDEA